MKKPHASTILTTIVISLPAMLAGAIRAQAGKPAEIRAIPMPVTVSASEGVYSLDDGTEGKVAPPSSDMKRLGQYLSDLVAPATGLKLQVRSLSSADSGGIVLRTDASRKDLRDEGYALVCNPKGVTITAAKPAGVFYGMRTRAVM